MVREAKFCVDADDGRFEPLVCRDSVFDEELDMDRTPAARSIRKTRPRLKTRKAASSTSVRRDLAGADWLNDSIPRFRATR
jgi:hypothetical protein